MEANVRKNRIALSFLIAAIMLVMAFAIGTVLYEKPAEAALKVCPGGSHMWLMDGYYVAPTCTATGKSGDMCGTCGMTRNVTTVAALGHSYGSYVTTTAATCTKAGVSTATCSRCDATTTKSITALGHAYQLNSAIGKAATCITSGYYNNKCGRCTAFTRGDTIPATGHSYGSWYTVTAATCTLSGSKRRDCGNSGCSSYETGTISKTGHLYASDVLIGKAATCTSSGYYLNQCANCKGTTTGSSIPATGHSPGSAATCTTAQTCTTCGTTITAALGHNSYGSIKAEAATCTSSGVVGGTYCTRCNYGYAAANKTIAAYGHDWEAATCTSPKTCSTCGTTSGSALGHTGGTATCTKKPTCSRCGSSYGSANGHTIAMDNYVIKEATCTSSGQYGNKCANCLYYEAGSTIPALGHNWSGWTVSQAATCSSTGSKYRTCSRCSTTDTETIAKSAHQIAMDNYIIKAATCTSAGQYGSKCAKCSYYESGSSYGPLGHTGGTATCTSYKICTRCGVGYGSLALHQIGRDNIIIKEATCTASGQYGSKCSNCSYYESGSSYGPLGHTGGTATCTKAKVCTRCGSSYGTAKGHQIAMDNYVIKEATCTSSGQYGNKCANCLYYEAGSTIPALGHNWSDWTVTSKGTCTNPGSQYRTCSRCSSKETEQIIVPHVIAYDNGIYKEATCTTAGQLAHICANCLYKEPGSVYGPLGHTGGKATCIKQAICTRCSTPYGGFDEHVLAMDNYVITAATCTKAGQYGNKCANCLYYTEGSTYGPLGHNWSGWTVTSAGTCASPGSKYRTCSRCSLKETESIVVSHQIAMDNYIIKEATCTAAGQYGNKCANCSYYTAGSSYGPLGHTGGTATCIKAKVCTRCGSSYGDAKGHQMAMDNVILREPQSCTDYGQYGNKCANCSYTTEGTTYGPIGHLWSSTGTTTPGTCQSKAVTKYACTRVWNGTQCSEFKKEYGDYDKNNHELLSLKEEQPTCTKAGAIYQYCSYCKVNAYKEKDLPALGHDWPYACTETCRRTINGVTCSELNPNRQPHSYAETISGRVHTFKCIWCGYSYTYNDPDGQYVLSGIWKWYAGETPNPDGDLDNMWSPFCVPYWMTTTNARGYYNYNEYATGGFILLEGEGETTHLGDEVIFPVDFRTGNGTSFSGIRIRVGVGSTCCEYQLHQVLEVSYTNSLSGNNIYWDETVAGHQEQSLIGHSHEHAGWEWMQWSGESYKTMDFGAGAAVSAETYGFITMNAYQMKSEYSIDVYRQKPNVNMTGNFTTDKNNGRYEYYTTLTFTAPQGIAITPEYPVYQGFNLVYKSYDSITLGEGRQSLIAYYNRLPADVTLNLVGGSSSSSTSKTMYYGDTIVSQFGGALPTPTKAGFKFLGWTRSSTVGNKAYITSTSTVTLSDVSYGSITLYAQWECEHKTMSEWTATTKASCTTDGSKYRTCATVGCDYAIRNGLPAKTKYTETAVIPARGHAWSTTYTHDSQVHWFDCTNVEDAFYTGCVSFTNKANHTWTVTTNPTCTDYGIETCSTCGRTRSGDDYHNTTPLGHSWSSWTHDGDNHWKECVRSGCDAITLHDVHTWTFEYSGGKHYPTCTQAGTRKCTVCGRTETVAATGHDFSGGWDGCDVRGHWHVCNNTNRNTGVACTTTDGPYAHNPYAVGEKDACFKCADCGYITDSVHNYTYQCDTDCNDCGYVRDARHNSIPSSNPNEYECEVCSYCGEVTNYYHEYTYACDRICNVCGYERNVDHYRVHLDTEDSNACTECTYCGIVVDKTHTFSNACDETCNVIDDNGNSCPYTRSITHEWEILESNGATCLTPGFVKKQCKLCGAELTINDAIDPDNHEGEFVQTSEYDACYRWSCCGKPNDGTFDPNHTMKEYTVVASTCVTNGWTEFRCTKCNYTMSGNTLPLDPNNHEGSLAYGGTAEVHRYWSCCGVPTNEAHNLERKTTLKNPTCILPGSSYYECECGYWEEIEDIPAPGHTPANGDGYRAPTCESAGETGRGYCTVCGTTLEDSIIIPALGHQFLGDAISAGNDKHYFKCVRFDECGAYGVGNTKNKTTVCTGGTATCTDKATCDICGTQYGTALGHSWTGDFDAFNDTTHWHICDRANCDATSTPESHNIITTTIPVSNTAPGYKQDTCGCGYAHKYDYTYRLIVNLDGGDWNPSGRPATQLIFDGKPGDIVELPNPTKLNHKFDGWSLTGGGSIVGTTYIFGDSHGTATALWLNMFYLDLNGSLDGESLSSLVYNKDGKFTFATADIYVDDVQVATGVTDYYTMHVYGSSYRVVVTAKPGYNFDGDNTKEFTGTIGAADISIKPAASSNTYKITIDLNPSATTNAAYTGSNPITGTWDERTSVTSNVTIPNPTMPGYEFAGWTITENDVELDSGVTDTDFKNLTSALNGEVVFTATWEAVKVQYKVHHYLMNTDGETYALKESETLYKYADVTHTIADDANSYDGFTYANGKVFQTGETEGGVVTNVVIDADGTVNINLYYTRNQYTLTVDPLPGSGDEVTYTQYHGTTLEIPAPTRTGYTFAGWSLTGAGSYSNGTYTFGIGDATLAAQWTPNVYNIVYDLNDISDTQTPAFGTYHPATGTYDVNVTISNPTMVGYTFKGWKITDMDGVTHYYGANTTTDSTINSTMETVFKNLHSTTGATVTFTAIWEANKYTISYDLNDISDTQTPKFGTNHPTSATFDVAFTVDNPTMTGYTFAGWKITGMDGVTHYYGANTTTNTSIASTLETVFKNLRATSGTVTFQATWTKNTYNIVYDLNDISDTQTPAFGSKHPNSATFDEEFTVSAPTMVGYQFIGWEITGMDGVKHFYGSNETTANSISSTMETVFKNLTSVNDGTVTFKALWKVNTYNIVYDLNDVSPSQNPAHGANHPNSATFDKTFTVSNPTMTGYTFIGWTITGMDGVTHFIGANSTDNDTIAGVMDTTFMNLTSVNGGTVTFTAMWQANTYTVTLNPGNGRVNPTTITVTYDQQYGTLPTPIRIGYDFTGWYNAETNGTKITDETSVTTPENHTLYAGWQRSTYTITYVLNGGYYDGNSTITQQYLSGTSITLITPQAPAGKTFVGWFTSYDNSTGMYSGGIGMGGDTYMLTESITVYACYVDKHDLGITVNDIYGEIKVGSQFMTSATIVNNNLMSIIPTDNLKVVMKVYVNGVVNPSMTQVFTNQIVPGKGTQLVSAVINTSTWSNSNTYQIEWSIDTSEMALYTEEVSTNNVSKTISFKPGQYRTITNTERPGYSTTRPDSFQNLTAPSTSTTRYEWTQWTWNNGGFVKLSSADQLDITLLLKPENESGLRDYTTPAFKYLHDYTTRSGYGLSIHTYFCTGCGKALGNATTCASCRNAGVTSNVQANTNIGRLEAVMTFPEFNYSTSNNNCAVLSADKVGNMYTLTLPMYADYNSSDTNDKFAHYTPMWLPDGQYTPVTYISGLWTPLGELTATVRQGQNSTDVSEMNRLHIWSNAIILDGSLYDDLYGN